VISPASAGSPDIIPKNHYGLLPRDFYRPDVFPLTLYPWIPNLTPYDCHQSHVW